MADREAVLGAARAAEGDQGDEGGGGRNVVQGENSSGTQWWSAAAADSVGKVVLHGGGSSVLACDPLAVQGAAKLLFQAADHLHDSMAAAIGARLELAGQSELPLAELVGALASLEKVAWQAAAASEEASVLATSTYQAASLMAEVEQSAGALFGLAPVQGSDPGGNGQRRGLPAGSEQGTWYRGSVTQPILRTISTATDSVVLLGTIVPRWLRGHSVRAQVWKRIDQTTLQQLGGQPGLLLRDPAAGPWGRERTLQELAETVGTGSLTAGVFTGIYGLPKAAGDLETHVRVLPDSAEKEAGSFFPLVIAGGGYRMDLSRPFVDWRGRNRTVWGLAGLQQGPAQYGGQPWERPGNAGSRQRGGAESGQLSGSGRPGNPAWAHGTGRPGGVEQPGGAPQVGQQDYGQVYGHGQAQQPTLITGVPMDRQPGGQAALPTASHGREVDLPRTLQDHVKMLEDLPRREGSMLVGVLETDQGVTVYINGTNSFSPFSTSPASMGSNLDLAAGIRSDSERTVIAALDYAGVQPGTSVTLVGHSQGGIVAAAIASDPLLQSRYGVDNVITFASPLGYSKVGQDVSVIAVENVDDFVPALDGRLNQNLPNVVTATVDTRHVDRGFEHSLPEMEEAAKLVDAYPDADLQARIRKVHASMSAGQGPAVPAQTGRLTVLEGRLLPAVSGAQRRWLGE